MAKKRNLFPYRGAGRAEEVGGTGVRGIGRERPAFRHDAGRTIQSRKHARSLERSTSSPRPGRGALLSSRAFLFG